MKLGINESTKLKISARSKYSDGGKKLTVNKNERDTFKSSNKRSWIDFFMPATANGFDSWFIKNGANRIKGAKCFELFGTIGTNDIHIFRIGMGLDRFTIPIDGVLYFFVTSNPPFFERK